MGRDLAIDCGTRTTLIVARGQRLVLAEPSVAAVERSSGRVVAAGWDVRPALLRERDKDRLRSVWPLNGGVVADYEVAEQMLARFIRKARRRGDGGFFTGGLLRAPSRLRALMCVPAGATDLELSWSQRVAAAAGLRDFYTIETPLAAGVGAGMAVGEARGAMVVDVGCGRTEAAVLSLGEIVAGVSVRVAGAAMDEAICRYLRTEHALWVDAREAERLKVGLGSALPPTQLEKVRTEEALGIDPLGRAPKKVTVSSAEVYEAIAGYVRTIVEAARSTLERTPVELVSDIAEDGIALTGGGAHLRHFADLLGQKLGVPVFEPEEPLGCAALGAGRFLEWEGIHYDSEVSA